MPQIQRECHGRDGDSLLDEPVDPLWPRCGSASERRASRIDGLQRGTTALYVALTPSRRSTSGPSFRRALMSRS